MLRCFRCYLLLLTLAACLPPDRGWAAEITSPAVFIGHPVAADYQLARWEKIVAYFRQLDEQSDRVSVRELGKTTEGRPMILAQISSAENMRQLDEIRSQQRRIADPRRIGGEDEERRLIADSKVVVLINCNLHSSEIASSQLSLELAHELATGSSPRIQEILEKTVILLVPSANPDGLDLVIDWYEPTRGKPWEGTGMPRLYQKYAGHDNNRDWFMLALQETRLLTKVLYEEWFPTIVYDIHQMGNSTARLFVPPFHDPKNANVHPLIDQSLMIIGGHMASELAREKKTGVVHGAMYDNWWSGGFRTTPYRHNMIGILTEAASPLVATPIFQRKSDLRGGVRGMSDYTLTTNFPDPWPGGWWRLRDVADYERIACLSLFTLAARYHEMFQGNYIRLGREALSRGKEEPPFAWLVPEEQRDPGSTARMLAILHATGIEIHQAEEDFVADDVPYPRGTYVLYCAQPYRAHLNDMFERQVYPDRVRYPGGPAEAPYDIAGWTLPLQMGVRHLAVSRSFQCSARLLPRIDAPKAEMTGPEAAASYAVPAGRNDNYRLMNRLARLGLGWSVYAGGQDWELADGVSLPPGSLVISDGARVRELKEKLLEGASVRLIGLPGTTQVRSLSQAWPVRLGLYQPWTASMDEGWTRHVLDDFEYQYASVHNPEIGAGNLQSRYDCLVLASQSARSILEGQAPDTTAPEYVGGIGKSGVIALQEFVQAGGTLVCIDDSCNLPIEHFNIPVRSALKGKSTTDFYCPGSILRASIDPRHPLGYGLPEWISAYFVGSQAFDCDPPKSGDSRSPSARFPAKVIGRYGDSLLLESGWVRGDKLLMDQPAVVEVKYGDGRIVLLGFRVQHRAQPHGTFPLLFNAIQSSTLGEAD